MDFDRAQQVLDALQDDCPHTAPHEIDVWVSAITRAREALVGLQIYDDKSAQESAYLAHVTDRPNDAAMIAVVTPV